MDLMELFQTFSTDYASGVTELVSLVALILTAVTLWFLKKEFSARYRPYVVPVVEAPVTQDGSGFGVVIVPSNVGPHPCLFRLTRIRLNIGDEEHTTPDMKESMLLGPQGARVRMPAGRVNKTGITRIREARYQTNRIVVSFILHTSSTERKFRESRRFSYEINVLGETPKVFSRPEWQKEV